MGPLYDVIDTFDLNGVGSIEDIQSNLQSVAEVALEVAQDYQEGLDNMPEGLQEGDVGMEIQEKIEACEAYAEELEAWEPSDDPDEDMEPEDLLEAVKEEALEAVGNFEY
jgi:hypothetical protein